METETADKSVPREIAALLSSERLILREAKRAVTPFGGVAVFVSFLQMTVLVGARRFAHAAVLRGDQALHALLG